MEGPDACRSSSQGALRFDVDQRNTNAFYIDSIIRDGPLKGRIDRPFGDLGI
jgi:hypothetical protein